MENMKLKFIYLLGAFLMLLFGFILHDLYKNTLIEPLALISPVNESYWEHYKIVIYGYLFYVFLEIIFTNTEYYQNYIPAKVIGLVVFIIITFLPSYLYEIIIGPANLAVHLVPYFIGAILAQYVSYKILNSPINFSKYSHLLLIIPAILIILTSYFTYYPPHLDYFKDSIDNTYGIYKKK